MTIELSKYVIDAIADAVVKKMQEPKTGHWIYDNATNNWRCNKCGGTPKTMGYVGTDKFMAEHFKFCNHCGAKMAESTLCECSACGFTCGAYSFNYCPNCGVKMQS